MSASSGYFNQDFHKPSAEGHADLITTCCSPEELMELEQEIDLMDDDEAALESIRALGKALG